MPPKKKQKNPKFAEKPFVSRFTGKEGLTEPKFRSDTEVRDRMYKEAKKRGDAAREKRKKKEKDNRSRSKKHDYDVDQDHDY